MRKIGKLTIVIAFALSAALSAAAQEFRTVIPTASAGNVELVCENPGSWNFSCSINVEGGKEYIRICLSSPVPADPPRFRLSFTMPQKDAHHMWYPYAGVDRCLLVPDWAAYYTSSLAAGMPLYSFINENNGNRLTVASDESFRQLVARFGIREEGCVLVGGLEYFTLPEAPMTEYVTNVLLDASPRFWSDCVREAADWMSASAGLKACPVPEDALAPLYSSWYQFHQSVFDRDIEEECELASKMGMKTIIVDDGWQTDDTSRGYAFCGDWNVSRRRFPDMAAHVEKVHAMGMNYMLWYSVPFMGFNSENYERFRGKYIRHEHGLKASVLDPRFPEVREYLVGVYERALREWKIDGFKLDFIDSFFFDEEDGDPAVAENYAGRDIKSLPEAIDVLMKEVRARLSAIKPDILLEFRQAYIGPAIRQYGNMFRAADCPGDLQGNRSRTLSLRLTSGNTAVHSDMLEWNNAESPEAAGRTIIAAMFSVVQYSLMLREISPEHSAVIRHWIGFNRLHANTLLKSELYPHHPEAGYPLVEAVAEDERIIAVYQDDVAVSVKDADRPVYVVNGTMAGSVVVELPAKPRKVTAVDVYGNELKAPVLRKGLNRVDIPVSGYVYISF